MRSIRVAARSTARTLTHSSYPPPPSSSLTSSRHLSTLRVLPSSTTTTTLPTQQPHQQQQQQQQRYLRLCYRSFSTSPSPAAPPPNTEPSTGSQSNAQSSALSDNQYHEIADEYLNKLLAALEAKAEADEGLEVEYSAGVLSIAHKNGTYVINKQPPNKQIWLSSPLSGPKRYDWIVGGAGQDEKEGTEFATGDDGRGGWWVYARDGSRLSALLKREVGVEVNKDE